MDDMGYRRQWARLSEVRLRDQFYVGQRLRPYDTPYAKENSGWYDATGYRTAKYYIDQGLIVPTELLDKPKGWLDQAKEMTTVDRRKHYGHPLPNFLRIAIGWIVVFDKVLTPLQVAQGMVTLKMARDVNMYKDDDWIDTIGYSNTVQMMDERMKEMGYSKGIEHFSQFKDANLAGVLYEVLAEHEKRFPKGK